jgi:hypothetical protein
MTSDRSRTRLASRHSRIGTDSKQLEMPT